MVIVLLMLILPTLSSYIKLYYLGMKDLMKWTVIDIEEALKTYNIKGNKKTIEILAENFDEF